MFLKELNIFARDPIDDLEDELKKKELMKDGEKPREN